jgi:hypothetical protein
MPSQEVPCMHIAYAYDCISVGVGEKLSPAWMKRVGIPRPRGVSDGRTDRSLAT